MKRVPIVRDEKTLSYIAKCPDCKELVFMVSDEAIARAPRRITGGTVLLPVLMSVPHECQGE